MYGKLNHWQGHGERFCNEVKNILQLKYVTFSTAPWIYKGLTFNDHIQVVHGKIMYVGPLFIIGKAYAGLDAEVGKETVEHLNFALDTLRSDNQENAPILESYQTISKIIWRALVWFSISSLFPNQPHGQIRIENICNRIADVSVDSVCVKHFTKKVFSNLNLEQKSIPRVVRSVRESVTSEEFARFKEIFAKYIEHELWTSTMAFLYPQSNGKYLLVLALYGNEQISFSKISRSRKEQILQLYIQAYEKEWGSLPGYVPSPSRQLEEAERLGWNSRISVEQVLHHMCMNWLAELV